MKFRRVVTALLSLHAISAYNLFNKGTSVPAVKEQDTLAALPADFDLTVTLETRPRNSEVFIEALTNLKRLQGESYCQRLAAQLLMNNCQEVKEKSDEDPLSRKALDQEVDSFVNSLTLCVLAQGDFVISDACSPFTPAALMRAYQEGKRKLDVSPQQNTACIEALSRDQSQWTTRLHQKVTAFAICRAVRLDIDKDETIFLYEELARMMAEFAEGLELDLASRKEQMANHTREMGSFFESVLGKTGLLKDNIQDTFEFITNEVQGVGSTLKQIVSISVDLQRMLQNFRDTVLQSTAEVAAEQELALVANADLATARMTGINSLAEDATATLTRLTIGIDKLIPAVMFISERQDVIEKKSESLHATINNITYLASDYIEYIEQASFAAKLMSSEMQKISAVAKSWTQIFGLVGSPIDWALRILGPMFFLLFGNWGISSTLTRNAILAFSGYVFAEVVLIKLKPWNWNWA